MTDQAKSVVSSDKRRLARLLTRIESGEQLSEEFDSQLRPLTVGITGPPGAGKSTLTNALLRLLRSYGKTLAVVAVDPSSPKTGGALLGDRLRMQEFASDDSVFIRSMATRGHLGGLAVSTPQIVNAIAAAGFDPVLIETVGVGQNEVEIAATAKVVVVVVTPGWGDEIQAAKAGLLEIADVVVVNKADLPGAEQTVRHLVANIDQAPVLTTTATSGEGVPELWQTIVKRSGGNAIGSG